MGIWVGAHESQGFALQEALSCDVPLIVWNIRSMNQELGSNLPDIPATTIPYWNEQCGEFFYDKTEWETVFSKFQNNCVLGTYNPRQFILDNLSVDICEKRFMNIIRG